MNDTIYQGRRRLGGCIVTVTENGRTWRLPPRTDLAHHSPTGFEWGYLGSGPAQLAIAILGWHCGSDEARAMRLYQPFKVAVIAGLPDRWTMAGQQVEAALQSIEADLHEADAGYDEPASGDCEALADEGDTAGVLFGAGRRLVAIRRERARTGRAPHR